ncbi:unnamed protein product [Protopolystoma xenopodis]|uniref:Uncharacterized protein n=1 Tax=Protopolystoma xenopodis TaxID=117903 RepID=A0A3S5CDT0_9PLAT|nr:unnamed protein product [Protopolystoma xenopodis]
MGLGGFTGRQIERPKPGCGGRQVRSSRYESHFEWEAVATFGIWATFKPSQHSASLLPAQLPVSRRRRSLKMCGFELVELREVGSRVRLRAQICGNVLLALDRLNSFWDGNEHWIAWVVGRIVPCVITA